MKILHINSAQVLGGGEKHLIDLVSVLAARGHEAHVAVRPRSSLRAALTVRTDIKLLPLALRNAFDLPSAFQLALYLRRHDIEVLHAHLARDYPLAAFAASLSNTPLVISRHLLFPLKKLHRWTLRPVKRIICVSEGVARAMRESDIGVENKIVVVHNGIEVEKYADEHSCRNGIVLRRALDFDARFLVGTIGELAAHKGHEEFLRAAAAVIQRRDDVAFIIAGEDSTEAKRYRAHLEWLIGELGLKKYVRLLGWVDDVASLYNALDIFVSAARTEPFGLVLVEAMASGKPAVVATMTDGAREILEHEVTGILVPIGDAKRLTIAVERLLNDEHFRRMLSERARCVAQKRFSLDRMADAVEAIYEQVHL